MVPATWVSGSTAEYSRTLMRFGTAEEIEGAANVMPKAMLLGCLINGATGFSMLIAVLFCLGDIDAALNTPTGYPYMEIFAQGVGSNSGATGMVSFRYNPHGCAACSNRIQDCHMHPSHDLCNHWLPCNVFPYAVGVCARKGGTRASLVVKGKPHEQYQCQLIHRVRFAHTMSRFTTRQRCH